MVFPVLSSSELDLAKTNDQPFEPPSLLRFNLLFLREKKAWINNENKGHSDQTQFTSVIYILQQGSQFLELLLEKKIAQIQDDSQKQGLLYSKAILKDSQYFQIVFKLCTFWNRES